MKFFLLVVTGLAFLPGLRADPMDNTPNKKRGEQLPVQAQQPVVTQKVRPGNNNGQFRTNRLPGNPMLQGNPNVRFYGPPRIQGQGQGQNQVHGLGQGQNQLQGLNRHHHFQLSNVPNPRVASAKFRPDNRIAGSEKWQGQHYNAFRSYHAQWHDHQWWRQHCSRIILISGGYYYWDAGFWFPAWGYDSAYSYYPYDGPIYAYDDLPPDQVIANVQAALQDEGYYTGEIDGMLGPLTRAALADYQRDHGLYMTAAIDQPTLASLGMG